MLKTTILLLSLIFSTGAWMASLNIGLIIQVICEIVVSFAIFIAILRATEYKSELRARAMGRDEQTVALALVPARSNHPRKI